MAPKVSIVIPTKNGGPIFRDVLRALDRQQYSHPIELVVIDSGSTDDTVRLARDYGARVSAIPPAAFNHGATRNLGIELSSGEIIVLMTQDALPGDELLIQHLVAPFDDPHVAGSYARQLPRPDADILTRRNLNGWLTGRTNPEIRWIKDRARYLALSPMDQLLFCNFDNVCAAVRRDVWKQVPLRPSDFGEDIEWSKRALEAGWKIAYQPAAYVIHSHDRPITYEYTRTYLCHRTLRQLFGLCKIPTLTDAIVCSCMSIVRDSLYVLKHEQNAAEAARLLMKIPALSVATVFAQYYGSRDAKLGRAPAHGGI